MRGVLAAVRAEESICDFFVSSSLSAVVVFSERIAFEPNVEPNCVLLKLPAAAASLWRSMVYRVPLAPFSWLASDSKRAYGERYVTGTNVGADAVTLVVM